MPTAQTAIPALRVLVRRFHRALCNGALRFAAIFLLTTACLAQTATTLSQVKKVYVESFGAGRAGTAFRDRMIARLRKDSSFELADSADHADALLRGTGQIWITGYVSDNPRSPTIARHPVYSGYLSAELTSRNGEPLWSYLVTPSKFAWRGIISDLADSLAARLLDDRRDESASAGSSTEAHPAIHGAGATFPAPLYLKWFESFRQRAASARVSYDAVGSERGIRLLADHAVDFAASDMPLGDDRLAQLGARVHQIATVLGGVVPIYNLEGIARPLNFTPQILAEIYLGTITRWNDPKIRAVNHGIHLPDREIVVVHRSDGSGTTFVWSDFLSKTSSEWKSKVGAGTELSWPVGIGAERNEGVAGKVKQTPNSIGYVEMVYALQHGLNFSGVQNPSGDFIRADLASIQAAAVGAAANMTSDFRISITNAPGDNAYPIASFTWLLVPEKIDDSARKSELLDLLRWILTSGQKECAEFGYAPLPRDVADRELASLDSWK